MVKNPIKVYGRVKPVLNKNQAEEYEIHDTPEEFETLTFNLRPHSFFNAKPESISFRFQKVFNTSNQEDVFNIVAKPVVDSVLQGYNGTIFAYGQTGSGKTYSMTGGLSRYEDRGVIPRTIQYIFKHFLEAGGTHSTFISYLEIYNECGYDLLNPNHKVSKLDDLPRVTLMEDTSGVMNLRNLSVHPVSSEEEALNLLFLGDTNRMISETPMNPSSSRSHCVFTVHVVTRSATSSAVRRSKLHLVDLAGSERVHKTGIDGNLLTEARYINLSLHYLEQVIVALADSRRSHVPYRNSMMTTVLRDSLGGNCMTAMLATLSSHKNNIDETLSTCRFAQRVALVRNEAMLNEEKDPQQEIALLRADVRRLKEQIAALSSQDGQPAELTAAEIAECQAWVQEYLRRDSREAQEQSVSSPSTQSAVIDVTGSAEVPVEAEQPMQVPSDPRKVRLCFSMLRAAVCERDSPGAGLGKPNQGATPHDARGLHAALPGGVPSKVATQVEHFREIIRQRDSEISILINLLRKEKQRSHGNTSPTGSGALQDLGQDLNEDLSEDQGASASGSSPPPPTPMPPTSEYEPVIERLTGQNFTLAEREAFKIFAADRKNRIEVEMAKTALRTKFEDARLAAARIKLTRKRMVSLHNEMKVLSDLDPTQRAQKAALQDELGNEQASYRKTLMDLQLLKVETGHQRHAVEQAKLRLLRKFQDWWAAQISCCGAAPGSGPAPDTTDAAPSDPLDAPAQDQPTLPAREIREEDREEIRDVVPSSSGVATPEHRNRDTAAPTPTPVTTRPRSCQGSRTYSVQQLLEAQNLRPSSAGPTSPNTYFSTSSLTCLCRPGAEAEPPITTLWTRPKQIDLPPPPSFETICCARHKCTNTNSEQLDLAQDDQVPLQDQEQAQAAVQDATPSAQADASGGGAGLPSNDDEEFIRNNIALTGEPEVDREIIEFYKARNRICQP